MVSSILTLLIVVFFVSTSRSPTDSPHSFPTRRSPSSAADKESVFSGISISVESGLGWCNRRRPAMRMMFLDKKIIASLRSQVHQIQDADAYIDHANVPQRALTTVCMAEDSVTADVTYSSTVLRVWRGCPNSLVQIEHPPSCPNFVCSLAFHSSKDLWQGARSWRCRIMVLSAWPECLQEQMPVVATRSMYALQTSVAKCKSLRKSCKGGVSCLPRWLSLTSSFLQQEPAIALCQGPTTVNG